MADPSILFLITNSFPLGTGEEFIVNEIEHLSSSFRRVIVVATQVRSGDIPTRPIPGNVEVITVGGPRPTGRHAMRSAIRGLGRLPRQSWNREVLADPRRLGLEAMFEDHARDIEASLLARLPALDLHPGSRAVIYSYWFLDTARVAMLLAGDLNARGVTVHRLVSRAHGYDLYPERSAYGYLPERPLLLGAFDAVCPVSDQGARALRRAWPQFADRIVTQHLGTTDPKGMAECRRKPFHIISCAYLVSVKRMTRMPAILAELRRRGVDARWTHIGDGPQSETVREAVRANGVTDQVTLVGNVPHHSILQLERELHPSCLINLSSSEGLPVSMMEAASLGIPIVASDVGGVAEIVTDRVNGRLIEPDFTDDRAVDALQWLAGESDESYQAACQASRQIWESGYDQAVVYPRFCLDVLGATP